MTALSVWGPLARASAVFLAVLLMTGCGPVDADPVCDDYIAAVAARDAEWGGETDTSSFGAEGACWANADNADLCEQACAAGLEWLGGAEAR